MRYSLNMISVHFYAAARSAAGANMLEMNASTIDELRLILSGINSDFAKVLPTCTFLIDGETCRDASKLIENGARIDVLPQFSGG